METKEMVKVNFAIMKQTEEGYALLTMKTVNGPEVEFLLDDLALSILAITLEPVIRAAKKRVNEGSGVLMHDREDHQ